MYYKQIKIQYGQGKIPLPVFNFPLNPRLLVTDPDSVAFEILIIEEINKRLNFENSLYQKQNISIIKKNLIKRKEEIEDIILNNICFLKSSEFNKNYITQLINLNVELKEKIKHEINTLNIFLKSNRVFNGEILEKLSKDQIVDLAFNLPKIIKKEIERNPKINPAIKSQIENHLETIITYLTGELNEINQILRGGDVGKIFENKTEQIINHIIQDINSKLFISGINDIQLFYKTSINVLFECKKQNVICYSGTNRKQNMKEEIDGCIFLINQNKEHLVALKIIECKANINLLTKDINKFRLLINTIKNFTGETVYKINLEQQKKINNNTFYHINEFANLIYFVYGADQKFELSLQGVKREVIIGIYKNLELSDDLIKKCKEISNLHKLNFPIYTLNNTVNANPRSDDREKINQLKNKNYFDEWIPYLSGLIKSAEKRNNLLYEYLESFFNQNSMIRVFELEK